MPDNWYVCRMVDLCGDAWFAYKHLLQTSNCLDVLPAVTKQSLERSAIQIVNSIIRFADKHRDTQLLQIAEDGVIDEKERPTFDEIVRDLIDIISAAYSLRYAGGISNAEK